MTARALGKLIKPILFSKEQLSIDLPELLRNLQAIADLETLNNTKKNLTKLTTSLEKITSFTCDYDYNILPYKRNIPYDPNSDFTGRDADLVNLYLEMIGNLSKLNHNKVGIVGIGRVGKTQLAVEFAYRYAYQFEKGVYWIDGADPTKWLEQIIEISKYPELELKIDDRNSGKNCFLAFYNYCKTSGDLVLLIVYNVVDPLDLYKDDILFSGDPSAKFTLLTLGCNLLFTTRRIFENKLLNTIQHKLDVIA